MLSKLINKGYEATNCQICYTEFNLLYLFYLSSVNYNVFINVRDVISMCVGDVGVISRRYWRRKEDGLLSHIGFVISVFVSYRIYPLLSNKYLIGNAEKYEMGY